MFKNITRLLLASIVLLGANVTLAHEHNAAIKVEGAWVRATVDGQKGTGGFMRLTAREDMRLVGISSPVAGVSEVHEMKMGANNVMEMRAIDGLDLPKGKTVELKPGSYHLMLMSLKQTLNKGSTVPVTLMFKDKKGAESKLTLQIPVDLTAAQGSADKGTQPMHKH